MHQTTRATCARRHPTTEGEDLIDHELGDQLCTLANFCRPQKADDVFFEFRKRASMGGIVFSMTGRLRALANGHVLHG